MQCVGGTEHAPSNPSGCRHDNAEKAAAAVSDRDARK